MKEGHRAIPITHVPSSLEAQLAVDETRRLFNRALAGWASDVLILQQSGLRHPSWQSGPPGLDLPKAA